MDLSALEADLRAQDRSVAALDADIGFRLLGLALLAISAWVPWTTSTWMGDDGSARLVDLGATRWGIVLVALTLLAATVLEWTQRSPVEATRITAVAAAAILTLVPLLGVVLIELIGIWMSPDRLPRTMRRLAVGADPMLGIWLTSVAGGLCLLGATGQGSTVVAFGSELADGIRDRSQRALAAALVALAVPLLGIARYASWFDLSSPVGDVTVPGWSIPWWGVTSLVAAGVGAALGCLAWLHPSRGAGVATAILGWALTVPAGVTLAVCSAGPTITAPEWARERLALVAAEANQLAMRSPIGSPLAAMPDDLQVSLTTGRGALLTYAGGVLLVLAGWLTCRSASGTGEP